MRGRPAKPYRPRGWYDHDFDKNILPYAEGKIRQQRIIWELSTGLPPREIAYRHKVSQAYVSQLKAKSLAKVVPIGKSFNNFKAFLAHVAEDDSAVGFVGIIIRNVEGERVLTQVNFGSSVAEAALGSLLIGKLATEGEVD